jgi:hypothetical protein
MKKQIQELLKEAGIKETAERVNEIVEKLKEEEVETLEDLKYLKETDVADIFGYKKVKTAKLMNAIKNLNRKSLKVDLPQMPKNFDSVKLKVSGKTDVSIADVVKFIEFGSLYGLGAETIGTKVLQLVEKRLNELEEPADADIIDIYKLVSKFKNFDANSIAVVNFELSLLPRRHEVAKKVSKTIVPAILGFINEALNLRMQLANVDSIILAKSLRTKKVDSVSSENILIAAEDLAVNINKVFAGLNKLVVDQALDLYKNVYELIDNSKIQELVGAKDSRDMMRKLGIVYSPKDVKTFEMLKELIYQMLVVIDNDEILSDNDKLYVYLQTVWSKSKMIDWNRFFEITSGSDKNVENQENLNVAKAVATDIIEDEEAEEWA